MFPSDRPPDCLVKYKSRLLLIYMDDDIIRVRLNVDEAFVENETEENNYFVVEELCGYQDRAV